MDLVLLWAFDVGAPIEAEYVLNVLDKTHPYVEAIMDPHGEPEPSCALMKYLREVWRKNHPNASDSDVMQYLFRDREHFMVPLLHANDKGVLDPEFVASRVFTRIKLCSFIIKFYDNRFRELSGNRRIKVEVYGLLYDAGVISIMVWIPFRDVNMRVEDVIDIAGKIEELPIDAELVEWLPEVKKSFRDFLNLIRNAMGRPPHLMDIIEFYVSYLVPPCLAWRKCYEKYVGRIKKLREKILNAEVRGDTKERERLNERLNAIMEKIVDEACELLVGERVDRARIAPQRARTPYKLPHGFTIICIRDIAANGYRYKNITEIIKRHASELYGILAGAELWRLERPQIVSADVSIERNLCPREEEGFFLCSARGLWVGSEQERQLVVSRAVRLSKEKGLPQDLATEIVYRDDELTYILPVEFLLLQKFLLATYDWQIRQKAKFATKPSDIAVLVDELREASEVYHVVKFAKAEPCRSIVEEGKKEMELVELHDALMEKRELLMDKLRSMYEEVRDILDRVLAALFGLLGVLSVGSLVIELAEHPHLVLLIISIILLSLSILGILLWSLMRLLTRRWRLL
ncbi:MAG: hypothetical protein DRN03_05980 [Thermoplasmata archaeon]|nr:MAG: hypothetical protein DRN03_05980 [Thermoplasmata archaeon]